MSKKLSRDQVRLRKTYVEIIGRINQWLADGVIDEYDLKHEANETTKTATMIVKFHIHLP